MASLTLPGDATGSGRDRSQIILVTAFALAVAFIALALILNSAIFAQNLASRSGTATSDAVTFRSQAKAGVIDGMGYANRNNNSTVVDLIIAYPQIEQNLEEALGNQEARSGHVVGLDSSFQRGSRIAHNNSSRTFRNECKTGPDCHEDWSLTHDNASASPPISPDNARGTRKFVMNVTQSDLEPSCSNFNDCFHVNVSEFGATASVSNPQVGTANWSMAVSQGGAANEVTVRVWNGSGVFTKTVTGDNVTIDLTGGTVDGEEWGPLDYGENVGEPYGIYYRNGNSTTGTYSLIIDDTTDLVTNADNKDEIDVTAQSNTPESPFVDHVIYEVNTDLLYRTNRLTYETEFRVAPGEPDD